jgi:hypothetical protein
VLASRTYSSRNMECRHIEIKWARADMEARALKIQLECDDIDVCGL